MGQNQKTAKKMGRPRSFDEEAALDVAMRLFWERGYEGASMADLAKAMKLSPPSIYAAFGDKMALFQAAAKRYADGPGQYQAKALGEATLNEVIRALFRNTVAFLNDSRLPSGCMTMTGAMACSVEAEAAKDFLAEIRRRNEAAVRNRLEQARRSGELPTDVNVDDYARYLSSILGGLAIQAANGISRAEMKRIADMALRHLDCQQTAYSKSSHKPVSDSERLIP
jgi:AcrR family transcriptional regulator